MELSPAFPRPQTALLIIGHFYLTKLLLPTLIATGEDSLPGVVRVVTVSSIAHNFGAPPSGIHWDTLGPNADIGRRKEVGTLRLYAQSKLVCFIPRSLRAMRAGVKLAPWLADRAMSS